MIKKNKYNLIREKDVYVQLDRLSQITFEVTDVCNLKCNYCGYGDFYEDFDKRNNQNLSIDKALKLLNYLKEFWKSNKSISYTKQVYISFYGGEPLMNMNFVKQIVKYIEQLNIPSKKFIFSMTTNAILLDKNIDFLVGKDFRLLVSLDGNKNHHSYRVDHSGKNSFDRVFNNIRLVQRKYPLFFEKNVNFNSVLHNRNSVAEVYQFIKNEFGKTPRIAELNSTGIRESKKQLFMDTYRNKYVDLHNSERFEEIQEELFYDSPDIQKLGIYLHQYSGNVFRSYNDLLFDSASNKTYPTGTCLPFSKKIFLTVNGKILPCERIGHQYALGQVTDKEVILNFEEIAEKYNKWFNKLAPQCARCYNKKACEQCIFNLDNLNQKPICNGFMNKKAFELYTKAQMSFLARYPHLYEKIMKEVIVR